MYMMSIPVLGTTTMCLQRADPSWIMVQRTNSHQKVRTLSEFSVFIVNLCIGTFIKVQRQVRTFCVTHKKNFGIEKNKMSKVHNQFSEVTNSFPLSTKS